MPGPNWKHTVSNLEQDLERCRQQASKLNSEAASAECLFREEVYKSANTVVEVSIKTRKKKDGESHINKEVRATSGAAARGQGRVRKVLVHRQPVSLPSNGRKAAATTWNRVLQRPGHTVNVDQKKIAGGDAHHTPSEKAKTKSAKGPLQKSPDEIDGRRRAEHEGAFKSRTIHVLLKEMRAALRGLPDDKTGEIRAVVDDLEFVTGNLREGDDAVAQRDRGGKEEEPPLASKVHGLAEALQTSQETCGVQEKQIRDLKSALSRLSANNNEMMALLSNNVGIDDAMRKVQGENKMMRHKLEKEMAAMSEIRSALAAKESETRMLRKVISDLQLSMNRDMKLYSTQQPLTPDLISASAASLKDDDDDPLSTTDGDSAIEAGSSRSQAEPDAAVAKSNQLISNAKNMLLETEEKRLREEEDRRAQVEYNDEARVQKKKTEHARAEEKRKEEARAVQKRMDEARTRALDAKQLAPNVEDFLRRMRNQKGWDVTMPRLPPAKDFNATSATDFSDLTALGDGSTIASLTESKFKKGLEESIFVTSDAE